MILLDNINRQMTIEYYKWFKKNKMTISYNEFRYRNSETKTRTLSRTYENKCLKLYLKDNSEFILANELIELGGINYTELYQKLQKIKKPF